MSSITKVINHCSTVLTTWKHIKKNTFVYIYNEKGHTNKIISLYKKVNSTNREWHYQFVL